MIRVEKCPGLSYNLNILVFLFSIKTVSLYLWWVHSLPHSSVAHSLSLPSSCPVLFHRCLPFLPFISHFLSYAMLASAGAFGHKLLCWLDICSLNSLPLYSLPLPFDLILALSPLPPFLFPAFDPYGQWISKPLSLLLFYSLSLHLSLSLFQILASQWPYSSLVLSCPAKIRWCPRLWTHTTGQNWPHSRNQQATWWLQFELYITTLPAFSVLA